jgi:hypothetical protein
MKDSKEDVCGCADDLIAFLYHELGEKGARNFERHLRECARCESEVASFGQIRESIVSWRDASLSAAWSVGAERALVPIVSTQPRPSALAAIREFFSLSPLWMKGAAAFASILFCVCAVLAVAYLKNRKSEVVQVPGDKIYSKQELDNAVARAVQSKAEAFQNQQAKEPGSDFVLSSAPSKGARRVIQFRTAGYAANTQGLRKPLTRRERRELAADLGLLASRDEDDLELVTDKITQAP